MNVEVFAVKTLFAKLPCNSNPLTGFTNKVPLKVTSGEFFSFAPDAATIAAGLSPFCPYPQVPSLLTPENTGTKFNALLKMVFGEDKPGSTELPCLTFTSNVLLTHLLNLTSVFKRKLKRS
ncbi:hypothetical protein D3C80_697090 [compost metagenome]